MKTALAAGVAALTLFDIAAGTTASAQEGLFTDPWTGWYVGAHGGQRWADTTFTGDGYTEFLLGDPVPFPDRNDNFNLDSGIAGVHFGFNLRQGPVWLIGAEGDFTWGWGNDSVFHDAGVTSLQGDAYTYTIRSDVDLNWQGYIARPAWLYSRSLAVLRHHRRRFHGRRMEGEHDCHEGGNRRVRGLPA